jgi:hypothetical protein
MPYAMEVPTGAPLTGYDPYTNIWDRDDDEFNKPDYKEEDAKATSSDTACCVHAIFAGMTVNLMSSGSSQAERSEYTPLYPKTMGEFQFSQNAMEHAHNEQNLRKTELLASKSHWA